MHTIDLAGHRYRLRAETIIGPSRDNDIVLDDPFVSRDHARILYLENEFVLHDHGTSGGCVVNGARLVTAKLGDGDLVRLGQVEFRFERAT